MTRNTVRDAPLNIPEISSDADTITAALTLAKAGWYVLPVKRGTKNPGSVVGNGWQSKSSREPDQIVAWFAGTDHVIAVHCGRSGALAFDVDHPDRLPDVLAPHLKGAPFQATRPDSEPGRGHYVFAMPAGRTIGNSGGRLGGRWGEVRGLNGVIIVAPHPDGRRWKHTGTVPTLPTELAELLDDASPAQDAASDEVVSVFLAEHTEASRPEILHGWVKALHNQFETGSRHDGTVSVVTGAFKESRCGYLAANTVIDTLRQMFTTAVTRSPTGGERQRSEREASDEWKGIVSWCVAQANAADLAEVRARTNEKMPPQDQTTDGGADEIMHAAHLGMAIKMGKQFTGKLLYVNKVGWHCWDGKRYAPDGNGAARRAVHSVIKRDRRIIESLQLPSEEQEKRLKQIARYETAPAITGILTEAAALEVFSVEVGDLDADPWLFNCANGTLDLRTMELRDHDPADRITKVANAAYRPEVGTGSGWTDFLEKVLPDRDVRTYTRRLTSLSLLGEVNGDKQIAPIMTGSGANGKTTFIEAVSFALGDYAATAEPTLLMAKRGDAHPTGVADLLGRRFVSVVETEQGRRFDIALLKWLTGGDTLKARYMRQDFFSFKPSHLLLMATNHLPRIDDDTEAVWRRIRVIPFTIQIAKADRDTGLKDQLRAEANAVLTWIIAGWQDYCERGGLDEPEAVLLATDDYQADSDAVGRFIDDECHVGGALSAATTKVLYERWEAWAKRDGCLPLSRIAFGRALDARGYPAETNTHSRFRRGICVKPLCEDEDPR